MECKKENKRKIKKMRHRDRVAENKDAQKEIEDVLKVN